uniref:Shugoshin C-terminal domain-containing protein n=1 Tax=Mycena chlorophos TaxID=658473 RepID=A0ABQ0L8L0_MYCCL|nr:predicted protein [Mycena chlorophos]
MGANATTSDPAPNVNLVLGSYFSCNLDDSDSESAESAAAAQNAQLLAEVKTLTVSRRAWQNLARSTSSTLTATLHARDALRAELERTKREIGAKLELERALHQQTAVQLARASGQLARVTCELKRDREALEESKAKERERQNAMAGTGWEFVNIPSTVNTIYTVEEPESGGEEPAIKRRKLDCDTAVHSTQMPSPPPSPIRRTSLGSTQGYKVKHVSGTGIATSFGIERRRTRLRGGGGTKGSERAKPVAKQS